MSKAKEIFRTAFRVYRIGRQLGEGGAGRVFEATDEEGRRYALKVLNRNSLTSEKRRRFQNEIAFCQQRVHPGIIAVEDYGYFEEAEEAIPFYVMPLYPQTLRKLIDDGLTAESAIRIFHSLLHAMSAAHVRGVHHRDLKPENILMDAESVSPVIADFGIARFVGITPATVVATRDGSRLANFQYAAPEQRTPGKLVDHRADIYALGLIGHEMFTGEVPLGVGARKISDLYPALGHMDAVLEVMRQQDPDRRQNSTEEVLQQLKPIGSAFAESDADPKIERSTISLDGIKDRASRINALHGHEKLKRKLNTDEGVAEAKQSFESIKRRVEELVAELDSRLPFSLGAKEYRGILEVTAPNTGVTIDFDVLYGNSLEGSDLEVGVWPGKAPLPGRMFFEEPQKLAGIVFAPDIDTEGNICWIREGQTFSNEDVVNQVLSLFLDFVEKRLTEKPRR